MKESIETLKTKAEELSESLQDSYIMIFRDRELLELLDNEILGLKGNTLDILKSFRDNIKSIISTSMLPISMSFERTIKLMYDDIYRSEKILSLKFSPELAITEEELKSLPNQEEIQKKVVKTTNERFNEKIKSSEGHIEYWFHSLSFLKQCSESGRETNDFLLSSKELINQATLTTWSTLEVLMRDIFVHSINDYPFLTKALFEDNNLKSKFGIKSVPTEKLIEFDFNLNGKMGTILIDNFDFSNLDLMKAIIGCVFESKALNTKLKEDDIWKLYNRRNLIIHKGGIVDKKYLKSTGDTYEIGHKLYVKPAELKNYIKNVLEIGLAVSRLKIN